MLSRVLSHEKHLFIAFLTLLVCYFGPAHWIQPGIAPVGISSLIFVGLFAVVLWLAFRAVHHSEEIAHEMGEPLGTLILTVSVIGIEVSLIAAVLISGDNNPTLARDTMFAVLMISLNGMVGASLLIGGLRSAQQEYSLEGAKAFLTVIASFRGGTPHFDKLYHRSPAS